MKKLASEFRAFICKGNVLDMAVGIIIGSAFTAIVNSLVADIITPLIGILGGFNFEELLVEIPTVTGSTIQLTYGNFITAVINFLLMAVIVFTIVKIFAAIEAGAKKLTKKKEEEAEPTTKECPYCMSQIAIKATRCPQCTSTLE